jgi:hypothetical protein
VAKLAYIGHEEAAVYRKKLANVLPLFDQSDEIKTEKLAHVLSRSSTEVRSKISYFERFHQLMYRVNIHFRNNRKFAREIRDMVKGAVPWIKRESIKYGEY